jgi:hypothetical protein
MNFPCESKAPSELCAASRGRVVNVLLTSMTTTEEDE